MCTIENPVWNIFRKKKTLGPSKADKLAGVAQTVGLNAQDLRSTAQQELKRLRKLIVESGGSERICYEYWKFLENHKWFQDWGIVLENDAPYSKLIAMLSALNLLESWKKTTDKDDKKIRDLLELLSKRVYVSACLSFDVEEVNALHRNAGGVVGQITVEPDKATEIEKNLRNAIEEKRAAAESAWLYFRENGFDVFEAIKNA